MSNLIIRDLSEAQAREQHKRLRQCGCCHIALQIDSPGDYCSGACRNRHEQGLCQCQELKVQG